MTQPSGLASLNHGTGTVLYGRAQLGSIRLKTSRLPAFSDLAIVFIYAGEPRKITTFVFSSSHIFTLWDDTTLVVVIRKLKTG